MEILSTMNTEEGEIEDWRMEQCISNYLIVKNIVSHLDCMDQLRCAVVCQLWRDAVNSIQRENLISWDFVAVLRDRDNYDSMVPLDIYFSIAALPVLTRPMFAITFFNTSVQQSVWCHDLNPLAPCHPPCINKHGIKGVVHDMVLSKRCCLLAVGAFKQIYIPDPTSRTFRYNIRPMDVQGYVPVVGICIPQMPNVNYKTVVYRTEHTVQEDVYDVIDEICATDIIKGIIIFVKATFVEIGRGNILALLNYFKNKQPSIPYALGGCSTMQLSSKGIMHKGEETITMGVFSVPKEPEPMPEPRCHFNMYSLIMGNYLYEGRLAKEKLINAFAENICELQYSAALMLSPQAMRQSHLFEEKLLCALLRDSGTTVLGCRNERVMGHSHPAPAILPNSQYPHPQIGEPMHNGAIVLVYFGWGKKRTESHTRR